VLHNYFELLLRTVGRSGVFYTFLKDPCCVLGAMLSGSGCIVVIARSNSWRMPLQTRIQHGDTNIKKELAARAKRSLLHTFTD